MRRRVFVIGGDSNVYSVRLNANGTASTGINGGYPIGAGALPGGLGVKFIVGGQLPGATAALFAIDTSGSIDYLGFTTTGLPAGAWTQTVSSTVTIGL